MSLRISKWLVVLALSASIGLHWAVLQSVAWTTMLAANLTTTSLSEAVSQTFDGQHPCPLCKVVKAGKQSEQKSDSQSPELKKFEFVDTTAGLQLSAPVKFTLLPQPQSLFSDLDFAPSVPPPRAA